MTRRTSTRRGLTTPALLVAAIVIALVALTTLLVTRGLQPGEGNVGADRFLVQTGSFDITVPTSGELKARDKVEIRNRLETRAVITYIAGEGMMVKAGDVLLRLNDEDILERIKDAEDRLTLADNALVNAEAALEIKLKEQEAELKKADLKIELADLALEAWTAPENGEEEAQREQLQLEHETAEQNFKRLEERFVKSKELLEKKFISLDEYRRDEISLVEADARLRKAISNEIVFENYTVLQERKQRTSDLEQATSEKDRIEKRLDAEVRQAESEKGSRQDQLQRAQERLEKLQRKLKDCTVVAPQDGLVVYASSMSSGHWRNRDEPPQVGTELSRNMLVMILPDTSGMVAEVKVNEALSGLIRPGQRASITSDALPDTVLYGEVQNVGVLAESGGWRDPNRRDYSVDILLDGGNPHGLKPSMRCKAEIFVDRVDEALFIPVQSVFRAGGRSVVYSPNGSGFAPRPVQLGRASELYIEVLGGLEPGVEILLRQPRPEERDNESEDLAADRPGGPDRPDGAGPPQGDRPQRMGRPPKGDASAGGRPKGDRSA